MPEEAEVVKLIFKLASVGKSGIRYGTKLIATELNVTGKLKRGNKWTANAVHRVLRDSAYYGDRIIGKNRTRADINPEQVIVKVPPIIEKSLFEQVALLLKKTAPNKQEHQALGSPSLLTGLVKCHYCKCNFVINTGKSGKYKYYKCSDCIKQSIKSCSNKALPKDVLEHAILNELTKNLFIEPVITSLLTELKTDVQDSFRKSQIKLLGLSKKKAALDHKQFSLIDKIADNSIFLDEFVQKNLDTYKNEIRITNHEINNLKLRMGLPIKKFGAKQTGLFIDACKRVLLGGNLEATKALLNAVIERIEIKQDKVTIVGNKLKMMANIGGFYSRHSRIKVPSIISVWRRRRDLNSRGAINPCWFSRPVHSATLPPLRSSAE